MTLTLGDLHSMTDLWREDGASDEEIIDRFYPLVAGPAPERDALAAGLERAIRESSFDWEHATDAESNAEHDAVINQVMSELTDEEKAAAAQAGIAQAIARWVVTGRAEE